MQFRSFVDILLSKNLITIFQAKLLHINFMHGLMGKTITNRLKLFRMIQNINLASIKKTCCEKSSSNWDFNPGPLIYPSSDLTTEILRPDILTDSSLVT